MVSPFLFIRFGTVCDFRHPLGVLVSPVDKGNYCISWLLCLCWDFLFVSRVLSLLGIFIIAALKSLSHNSTLCHLSVGVCLLSHASGDLTVHHVLANFGLHSGQNTETLDVAYILWKCWYLCFSSHSGLVGFSLRVAASFLWLEYQFGFKACSALLFWSVCALLIGQLEIGDSLSLISSVKGFGMLFRWNFLPWNRFSERPPLGSFSCTLNPHWGALSQSSVRKLDLFLLCSLSMIAPTLLKLGFLGL